MRALRRIVALKSSFAVGSPSCAAKNAFGRCSEGLRFYIDVSWEIKTTPRCRIGSENVARKAAAK